MGRAEFTGVQERFGAILRGADSTQVKQALPVDILPTGACPAEQTVVIIEKRAFLRECLVRSVRSASTDSVEAFSSVDDFLADANAISPALMILSLAGLSDTEAAASLALVASGMPNMPTIVLAHDADLLRAIETLGQGAKGYISTSMGFDIAIEVMRLVRAGGTFVPVECMIAAQRAAAQPPQQPANGPVTARELAVIQAIRQGKPNKIIAYELNMCESTVKVHLRHIMKKLGARNRTEVAIKTGNLFDCGPCNGCD